MKTCKRFKKNLRQHLRKSRKKHGGTFGLNPGKWGKTTLQQYIDISKKLKKNTKSKELQKKYNDIYMNILKNVNEYIDKSIDIIKTENLSFDDDFILLRLLIDIYEDITDSERPNENIIKHKIKTMNFDEKKIRGMILSYFVLITNKYLEDINLNCTNLNHIYNLIKSANLQITDENIKNTLNNNFIKINNYLKDDVCINKIHQPRRRNYNDNKVSEFMKNVMNNAR